MKKHPRITTLAATLGAASLLAWTSLPAPGDGDPFQWTFQQVGTGVWVGVREDGPRVPVMGTTTFVVGRTGVLVFDGGGAPLMTDRLIAKIRDVTDVPVTHVVISHWHGDHNLGIHRFRDAFPGVRFVGHPYTREAMLGRTMDYVDDYDGAMQKQVASIEETLDRGTLSDGTPIAPEVEAWYRRILEDAALIDEQFNLIGEITPPEDLVSDRLVVDLGGRTVELLHLGKGNTQGDLVLWIPDERVVATGDLVVRPTPYGFGSHPRAWAETLRRVLALDHRLLIPGHGSLQTDDAYVDLLIETLDGIAEQMDTLVAEGLSQEDAQARLDFSKVEDRFTGGNPLLSRLFLNWFKTPIGAAAYKVATGQPTESIS